MLAGCVLGPVRGFLAAALYLVLGAVGLPVFAEHTSGLGVFTGIAAGYLWSFPLVALLAGFLVEYAARRAAAPARSWSSPARSPQRRWSTTPRHRRDEAHADVSWRQAWAWDMPFWLGDLVKTALVALVAAEVHRAFPQLLRRR